MASVLIQRLHRYRFDWKLSLLVVTLLPLLVSLGFWQLQREAEKLALQATYNSRQVEVPVALSAVDLSQDQQYRQVFVQGQFDDAHTFLLDNRIWQGKVGYEVIVPLVSNDGKVVLVNRGWIAQGASRENLPAAGAVPGEVSVNGSIYQPVGDALVLGTDTEAEGWPKVVQTLEPQRLAVLAGYENSEQVFPYSLRVAEGAPGALIRYWPVITTTPEKHRGYAVQWFLMAAAVMALYLFYSTKEETDKSDSKQQGKYSE
ncbi:MAG: SURF1 family protein [Pseudomonadota bacterium]